MASGGGSEAVRSPLLERKAALAEDGWLNKVIDVEEAKDQILFALPMILTNVSYYVNLSRLCSPATSENSSLLAPTSPIHGLLSLVLISWKNMPCIDDFRVGLSGALETLCGQGFGAKLYRMLGVYLQASRIITIIFTIIISVLWWYSDIILTFLHQDPQIAKAAGLYLKYLIPGLLAYGFLQNILRFLQTQCIVLPLVVCSLVPLALHICIAFVLVHWTGLGYRGAPLAASISLWISVLMLGLYVVKAKKFEQTWEGFTLELLSHVFAKLEARFAFCGYGLVSSLRPISLLEYWAFEILVLLAGLMPNSEITTSVVAMCVNTESICYMIAYGLSAAASTMVSNELGAGNPNQAKRAMAVTLKLTVFLALLVVLALSLGHNLWAGSFSDSPVIIDAFASMTPLLVASMLCDFVQGILSGVVDWLNLRPSTPDNRPSAAYKVHKLDKNRAVPRFISQDS
ncbi:UNVERIFIED_CONTAM: protein DETOXIFICATION 18 [Sesamum calycinum]|uniref:Protein DETOXIFICATION n=1 Tax=Sesamum calycinum TaxID=2727403 RepID=A0AAW2MB27_9LAMI